MNSKTRATTSTAMANAVMPQKPHRKKIALRVHRAGPCCLSMGAWHQPYAMKLIGNVSRSVTSGRRGPATLLSRLVAAPACPTPITV